MVRFCFLVYVDLCDAREAFENILYAAKGIGGKRRGEGGVAWRDMTEQDC